MGKAESPGRIIKLRRGHAEIQQNTMNTAGTAQSPKARKFVDLNRIRLSCEQIRSATAAASGS